jgi:PAS domain S-box-containing protein
MLDVHEDAAFTADALSLIDAVEACGVLSLDADGHVRSWNRGAERLHGSTRAHVLGMHHSALFSPEAREARAPESHLSHAVSHGTVVFKEWYARRDGSRLQVRVALSSVRDAKGKVVGFAEVFQGACECPPTEAELTSGDTAETSRPRTATEAQRRWTATRMAEFGRRHKLSRAEVATAQLVVLGLSNKEIATSLGSSISTIRKHVSRALAKARVETRAQFTFRFFARELERT